jgi:uncharacterized protein (DUF1800 family)
VRGVAKKMRLRLKRSLRRGINMQSLGVGKSMHRASAGGEGRLTARWFAFVLSFALCALLAGFGSGAAMAQAVQINNAGFESGNTSWTNWGNSGAIASDARSGSSSMRVGTGRGGRAQLVSLAPSASYRLSGWGKVAAAGEVGWIGVTIKDGAGRELKHMVEIRETSYTNKSVTFTAPSSVREAWVWVWKDAGRGAYFFADDLALARVSTSDAPPPPAPLPPPQPVGSVQLKSALGTNLCMDVVGGNRTSGARLMIAQCSSAETQRFVPQGNGEIHTTNGLCVDANSGRGNHGDAIILWTCHGGTNQKWQFTSSGTIRGINNRVITVTGSNATANATLMLADANGAASQQWTQQTPGATAPNTPPTVSLTNPAAGASFTAPAQITVSANAADSDGRVAKVDFFAGSTLIGSATSAPYQVTWSNVAAGSYSLTARATDDKGAATTSAARSVTVAAAAVPPPPPPSTQPLTPAEASRFLHQATFGATAAEIERVQKMGHTAWLDDQFKKPARPSHRLHIERTRQHLIDSQATDTKLRPRHWASSFWREAVEGPDPLRQRVAFALSEIFVVSVADSSVERQMRGFADYQDMLGRHAFGNYRDLLQAVSLHPVMGIYLSHRGNLKENPAKGTDPDENFAREIMQLFSIGLYELNLDGTPVVSSGQPVETYTSDDVTGLARVFTGFSWAGPDKSDGRFKGTSSSVAHDPNRDILPMQGYPKFHSTSEKRFLGVTIPAQSTPDPDASLKIALDTLYNHPNVGPFIGKQLIQRLVTSNPSPAYVARVARAFNTGRYTHGQWSTGTGRRGDLRATVAAVLLDPEARDAAKSLDPSFGKVREPVLRLSAFLRAFNAQSRSLDWDVRTTHDPARELAQTPGRSPSVFNFFRPGYVPPNTRLADRGLAAPELEIADEVSVVGYLNYMRAGVQSGVGASGARDVRANYAAELALAHDPDRLIERIDLLLTYGTMSPQTRALIRQAVNSVPLPATNQDSARLNRVMMAVTFALAAPEFIVQR